MQRLPQQGIRIYNENNVPVFIDDSSDLRIYTNQINTIRKEKELSFAENNRHAEAFTLDYKNKQYVIVASAVDEDGSKQLTKLREIFLLGFIISLAFIFITGFIFSHNALAPLSDLSKQAGEITFSNSNVRLITGPRKDEIYHLTDSFNKMLDRLKLSLEVQKIFLSNISHELRTPIAILLSNIDVALNSDRDNQYYKDTLVALKGDIKRMSNLSDKLIEFAQVSYDSSKTNFEPVSIEEVVWEAKDEVVKRFPESNIIIQTYISIENESKRVVIGDKRLLTIALINILDNACKFSPLFSPISCELFINEEKLFIRITDKGIGIEQEDQLKIFEPFFRTAIAKDIPGFGLGLSITETILKIHNISPIITSVPLEGTTVTLCFN